MPPPRANKYGRAPNEAKKKILVVDDDLVVTWTLSSKLKANGFEVITA